MENLGYFLIASIYFLLCVDKVNRLKYLEVMLAQDFTSQIIKGM